MIKIEKLKEILELRIIKYKKYIQSKSYHTARDIKAKKRCLENILRIIGD